MDSARAHDSENPGGRTGSDPPAIALWGASRSLGYLEAAVRQSELPIRACGGPDETVRRAMESTIGAPVFDDPRVGPIDSHAECVFAADARFDPLPHLKAGRLVGMIEPAAPVMVDRNTPVMLGEFIRSPGFMAVEQILESFGPIASVHVTSQCGSGQGTLFARLYDAMRVLEHLCGGVEMVDAMLVGPNAAQSNEPAHAHVDAIPDDLPDLTGHIGVLVRHAPRALATISASDQGCWHRAVHLNGPGGTLQVDEAGVAWTDPSGAQVESHAGLTGSFEHACSQLGSEFRDLVSTPRRLPAAELSKEAYSACEAVRLSCRTRAPESTDLIRHVLDRT
ncbi:MAG: hypothetical protein MK082_07450 [Phycisphaerales bacterium]|nr:hypothetical protein [Phycisphaerales bacterium]